MPSPINLNALKISIDQFNEAASGKHNIGQLKLGDDGASVVRTNNHKHWTIFNDTEIRPEESLAIKHAFCNALSRAGLSDDKLEEIRYKLGINRNILDTLKDGDIQPLSAAEVREIIDGVAGELNKSRAPDAQLKTSAQIYRRVSAETLEARKTDRDRINADTVSTMAKRAGGVVGQMVDILHSIGRRPDMPLGTKGIANEVLMALRNPDVLDRPGQTLDLTSASIRLKQEYGGMISARFTLDDGHVFTVSTHMTKAELRAQMDKVLNGDEIQAEPEESGSEAPVQEAPVQVQPNAGKKKNRYEGLLNQLRDVFDIATDADEMERRTFIALSQTPKAPSKGQRPYTLEEREALARGRVRENLVESVVGKLVIALRDVRGMNNGNTLLVNQVRDVIGGDKNVNADELLGKIERILDPKPAQGDKLIQQIDKNFAAPSNNNAIIDEKADNVDAPGNNNVLDDSFDAPLNINALLGNQDD